MNVSESIDELTRMHLFALEQGIESKDSWILVLEDDVILNSDYYKSTTFLIDLASQLEPRNLMVF
jgi:GR25 family glycosyltransferase involved in LPS biosynthesis